MAKQEKQQFISQDGISNWNPDFFKAFKTSKEAYEVIKKVDPSISESTVIAVWKQAHGKSKPNPRPKAMEGEINEEG